MADFEGGGGAGGEAEVNESGRALVGLDGTWKSVAEIPDESSP